MNNFSVQKILSDALKEPREKKKQTSWHPSSLGSCLTGAYLARKGAERDEPFDDRTLRVFKVGNMMEDWLVGTIEKTGAKFKKQVRIELPELDVTGYADLVMETPDGDLPYEIKSKNSKAFWWMEKKKQGPNRQHMMQLWIYLKFLNRPEGRLIYLSKDDLAILEYIVRLNDEKLEAEVMAELKILNAAWKAQLPPPPITDEKDWRVVYCGFHKQCTKQPEYLQVGEDKTIDKNIKKQ